MTNKTKKKTMTLDRQSDLQLETKQTNDNTIKSTKDNRAVDASAASGGNTNNNTTGSVPGYKKNLH